MSLKKLYTTPAQPGSFSGLSGFKKNNKTSLKSLNEIKNLETYSLHKLAKRKFIRRKTIVNNIDECWQIDLIDLKKIATKNKFFTFLLVCIDVLSRYAWVRPLKNKTAKSCKEAMDEIIKLGRKPLFCYGDWGNEFKGDFNKYLKSLNIVKIDAESKNKASIVERFIRTLKSKIARYQTYTKSDRYIDHLDDFVSSYNKSFHNSIKMAPFQVTKDNKNQVLKNLYGENIDDIENISNIKTIKDNIIKFAFKKGDYIRVIVDKKLFEKGYKTNWSSDIYIIDQLNPTIPPTYKIKSLSGEKFSWNYYKEELQKVPFHQFPFDSFKIIDEFDDNLIIEKINSKDKVKQIIKKSSVE